jgi:hypothetical protein
MWKGNTTERGHFYAVFLTPHTYEVINLTYENVRSQSLSGLPETGPKLLKEEEKRLRFDPFLGRSFSASSKRY